MTGIVSAFPRRAAGVLLHLTSLPGPWGIGDLGPAATEFIDFLVSARQSVWQILPTGPTLAVHDHSPYMSPSAFAGNPLLISPERLVDEGWLGPGEGLENPGFYQYLVRYDEVESCKTALLEKAFAHFVKTGRRQAEFSSFREHNPWLYDYALFTSLHEHFSGRAWYDWPAGLARRDPAALAEAAKDLEARILYHEFVQFLFAGQWRALRREAARAGIRLFGDLPIYVALDSADVWARQECFQLAPDTLEPTGIAGVPPDYFSPEGQAWGNPLYRWEAAGGGLNPGVVDWWKKRVKRMREMVDIVRIDHFRGFEAYWEIPHAAPSAAAGHWVRGPGKEFFTALADEFKDFPVVAEDLGTITPEVEALRDEFGFAGLKVLQFAFDGNPENPYLPWNFTTINCIACTGTHDNETAVGWYLNPEISESAKAALRQAANSDGSTVHRDYIRLAYLSTAWLAVIPLQDILGFGNDCRMNRPGSNTRNWAWRCAPRFLTREVAAWLADLSRFANRDPETR